MLTRPVVMKRVRTEEPFRGQATIVVEMPEDTLPVDHRERLLWRVVEQLDLAAFTAEAKAVQGASGRPWKSVRLLLSLWLYARWRDAEGAPDRPKDWTGGLWAGAALLAGLLYKETAVAFLPVAAVVEWTRPRPGSAPRS